VPDSRGRQAALAWLAAGAALADVPASHGANHFFDPKTGHGWVRPDRSFSSSMTDKVREMLGRSSLPERGVPAPDWVVAKDNPFNQDAFLSQYAKAVTAATPGERSRHMAAALVAAGAMMHVLGDLGAPSRVRGDEAAHLEQLGGGPDDLGSRFERIAALAYGRLGVPAPTRVITRAHLREYFTAPDNGGLADLISTRYFSPNTLPYPASIEEHPQLARELPKLPNRLNLMAASRDDGSTVRDSAGVCMARYRVEHGVVRFSLDDDCMLEQVTAILPEVTSYETGLLDFLLRGELTITAAQTVVVTGKDLGPGTVEIVAEDDRGVRTPLTALKPGANELARASLPANGTRVLAVFKGQDTAGEPIVAVGVLPLSH
jgi:hypothetical protein